MIMMSLPDTCSETCLENHLQVQTSSWNVPVYSNILAGETFIYIKVIQLLVTF